MAIGESTIEHEAYLFGSLKRAGLLPLPGRAAGEAAPDYAARLQGEVLGSGELFNLLGALLLPAEIPSEKWTPEVAAETALHLKPLADVEDKRKLRNVIASLLFDFFRDGIASSLISPTSSQTGTQTGEDGDPVHQLKSSTTETSATATGAISSVS